jgi:hypothetical protein
MSPLNRLGPLAHPTPTGLVPEIALLTASVAIRRPTTLSNASSETAPNAAPRSSAGREQVWD